ncbi:MAG: hypothetical protein ACOZQL_05100 [Myxococcota bacterium]
MVKTRRLTALLISASEQARGALQRSLEADRVEVIAALKSPLYALSVLELRWPDVLVLDRPGAEGVVFLHRVQAVRPTPVVLTSTVTDADVDDLQCLAACAGVLVPRDGVGCAPLLTSVIRALARAPQSLGGERFDEVPLLA